MTFFRTMVLATASAAMLGIPLSDVYAQSTSGTSSGTSTGTSSSTSASGASGSSPSSSGSTTGTTARSGSSATSDLCNPDNPLGTMTNDPSCSAQE